MAKTERGKRTDRIIFKQNKKKQQPDRDTQLESIATLKDSQRKRNLGRKTLRIDSP